MVTKMFVERPFPRLLIAAAAVLLPLVLGTCQFIGADMFPSYLTRAEAVLDLESTLSDLGITGYYDVASMKFLSSPTTGKDYVFVRITKFSELPRLIVLDANDLGVVTVIQNQYIGDLLFADMDGYFVTGNETDGVRFNSTTLGVTDYVPPPLPFGYQGVTEGATSWKIWYTSVDNRLNNQSITTGWGIGATNQKEVDSTITGLYLQSIYFEGSTVRLLFSSNYGSSYIASFPSVAEFLAAFTALSIFEYAGATVVTIPTGDDQSGWLTRDGAIVLDHDQDTRLTRYDADSGDELDYYVLGDTEETRIAFAPEGDRWLLFDRLSGKLHLLRTWW